MRFAGARSSREDGKTNRLRAVDSLRGLAALGVVLYHYANIGAIDQALGRSIPQFLPFQFDAGMLGVQLFFMISGFVIFMTLTRTPIIYDFVCSRVSRLYPAFLVCLFATLVLDWLAQRSGLLVRNWMPIYPSSILANLTMAPVALGRTNADPSYWSLAYELVFYGLAGTAYFLLRCRSPEWPSLIWLVIALILQLGDLDVWLPQLELLTAARFAHLFVIGVMLFRIHSGRANALTFVVFALALAMAPFEARRVGQIVSQTDYTFVIVFFAFVFWAVVRFRIPVMERGPVPFLGDASYPLYLIHQVCGYAVFSALTRVGMGALTAIAATTALAIMAAWAVHCTVEVPGQRALRNRLGRYRGRFARTTPTDRSRA